MRSYDFEISVRCPNFYAENDLPRSFSGLRERVRCATRRQVGGGEGDVKKSRVTRKHVLIAAVSLVIMALVVVGVVESVRIFSTHNVEVLKVFSQSVSQSINHKFFFRRSSSLSSSLSPRTT